MGTHPNDVDAGAFKKQQIHEKIDSLVAYV
jgi:hypothetical protein